MFVYADFLSKYSTQNQILYDGIYRACVMTFETTYQHHSYPGVLSLSYQHVIPISHVVGDFLFTYSMVR